MPYGMINGVKMFYRMKGSGIPIVFIHPPLMTSANFIYQLEQLSDQFQVIAFDIRGHGKSGHSDVPLTYSVIADDLIQLLDLLNIKKAYVCGYSTGGGIAMEAMLNEPGRFHGGILVSSMSEASDWLLRVRLAAAVAVASMKANEIMSAAFSWGNSDKPQTFLTLFQQSRCGSMPNIRQYFAASLKYNCTSRLKQLHLPQLLIYGEKDKSFRRYARMFMRELPNSTFVCIRGARHQIPTKAAERMNRLLTAWIMQLSEMYDEEQLLREFPVERGEEVIRME